MPTNVHAVNVRTLAETYFESGDLVSDLKAIDRMQEGLKGHMMLEASYPPEYRSEVPVRHECSVSGVFLLVQGRIDGLLLTEDACTVEEIKTTRRPPSEISPDDYPVHWAQAEIYAHIMCEKENLPNASVRLAYINLSGDKAYFTRIYAREKLKSLFYEYAAVYARRVLSQEIWKETALSSMRALVFPFPGYREGQREMAARAYLAIKGGKKLLCEAPTGIGKTAAALFPALKALGEGLAETVFYITARTTGRKTCEDTLEKMRPSGLMVRSVTITAKRKACFMEETRCEPGFCPYSMGYFDRQKDALEESWRTPALGSDEIRRLAEAHRLCPFELSLALAETADVVICDYNYVFDPAVRLRRFFDRRGKYILLVDEAHNLIPRAREMYSAQLGENAISALRRDVGKAIDRKCPLYKSLTELLRALPEEADGRMESTLPETLLERIREFSETAKEYFDDPAPFHASLISLFFDCAAFLRVSEEFDESTHRVLILPEGKRSSVKIWCWDVTPRLQKAMKRMQGAILFSATLAPVSHYAQLFGLNTESGDLALSLPSPFPKENLYCASLMIPTRFRAREESALRVAEAIHALADSRPGNYLACFPSHAYMRMVRDIFAARHPDISVLFQEKDMSEEARAAYLGAFLPSPEKSMVAFIAMGGVFSEGIDLPGEKLIGAAIVGVGLPQLCFERDALAALYEEKGEGGYQTAYTYPGIGKCLQAAGRVIRTFEDRGAVLFIDERYRQREYLSLLAPRYTPSPVREDRLRDALKAFWQTHSDGAGRKT